MNKNPDSIIKKLTNILVSRTEANTETQTKVVDNTALADEKLDQIKILSKSIRNGIWKHSSILREISKSTKDLFGLQKEANSDAARNQLLKNDAPVAAPVAPQYIPEGYGPIANEDSNGKKVVKSGIADIIAGALGISAVGNLFKTISTMAAKWKIGGILRLIKVGGPIGIIFALLYSTFKNIGDNPKFMSLLSKIGSLWTDKIAPLFAKIRDIFDYSIDIEDLGVGAQFIRNQFERTKKAIKTVVLGTVDSLVESLSGIFDGSEDLLQGNYTEGLKKIVNSLFKGVFNIADSISTGVLEFFGMNFEKDGTYFNMLRRKGKETAEWINKTIENATDAIRDTWNTLKANLNFSAITENVVEKFNSISDFFLEVIPNQLGSLTNSFDQIKTDIAKSLEGVTSGIRDKWNSFVNLFTVTIPNILGSMIEMITDSVSNFILEAKRRANDLSPIELFDLGPSKTEKMISFSKKLGESVEQSGIAQNAKSIFNANKQSAEFLLKGALSLLPEKLIVEREVSSSTPMTGTMGIFNSGEMDVEKEYVPNFLKSLENTISPNTKTFTEVYKTIVPIPDKLENTIKRIDEITTISNGPMSVRPVLQMSQPMNNVGNSTTVRQSQSTIYQNTTIRSLPKDRSFP